MKMKELLGRIKEKQEDREIYFSEQKDEILTDNLLIYKRLSVFCVFAGILYILVTGLLLPKIKVTVFHFVLLFALLIHIVISFYINKHRLKHKILEKMACVCFSLCIFLTLIFVDTLVTPASSQVFCGAFMVIAPSIFIMTVSRMLADQLFFVVFYALFAFRVKLPNVAVHDMYAIFAGFIFGIILYIITLDLRLKVNGEVIRLKHFSEIDELTKIKNRRAANAQITYILEKRERDMACALIMMDVDCFKSINDNFGHNVGDKVLVEVARVLSENFRKTDVVSRFGGDEFMIFVSGFKEWDFLEKKCEDIKAAVHCIMQDMLSVSCSIGICALLKGESTMDEMVRVADEALYTTKEREKGTYTITTMPAE